MQEPSGTEDVILKKKKRKKKLMEELVLCVHSQNI